MRTRWTMNEVSWWHRILQFPSTSLAWSHCFTYPLPDTVETQPELAAHHYTEAGAHEPAIDYWQRAGRQAVKRSAYLEAIQHFSKGVEVLLTLPQTPERDRHELTLRISLGASLSMTRSVVAPEVEKTYLRARALCQHVGDTVQLSRVLFVLWNIYWSRAEHEPARDFGEQLLALARQVNTPTTFLVAHNALGCTLFWIGAFESAQTHLEQALDFDASQAREEGTAGDATFARVATRCLSAFTLWALGYPEQARLRMDDALHLADDLSHPYTTSFASHYAGVLYDWCRQLHDTLEQAEAEFALAIEHSFSFWLPAAILNRGVALAGLGRRREGLKPLQEGLAFWRAMGSINASPMYLGWLADVSARLGRTADARVALTEALTLVNESGERCYEAELYRLKGELMQLVDCESWGEEGTSEECFLKALTIAQSQQAKSWELRAATSLARLWQSQGKRQEAYELLQPVYGWFTEGFDTADLKEAKAILNELA
jgi:tetratricopeptide (TPR) repeat protein